MAYFAVGDVVMARCDAQGMKKGQSYVVAGMSTQCSPSGGEFVTYRLASAVGVLPGDGIAKTATVVAAFDVCNLHVLADKVAQLQVGTKAKVRVLKPKLDRESGEWRVEVKVDGELCEARCYYTDDRVDAFGTYAAMKAEAQRHAAAGAWDGIMQDAEEAEENYEEGARDVGWQSADAEGGAS